MRAGMINILSNIQDYSEVLTLLLLAAFSFAQLHLIYPSCVLTSSPLVQFVLIFVSSTISLVSLTHYFFPSIKSFFLSISSLKAQDLNEKIRINCVNMSHILKKLIRQ